MSIQDKTNNFLNIFDELKVSLNKDVSDIRIMMGIASIYAIHNHPFQFERFSHIADEIKQRARTFSSMGSNSRYITAAVLDVNFKNPEDQIPILFDIYNQFRLEKIPSSTYTYIAASFLLTDPDLVSYPGEIILKTKEIYQNMKKKHPFITSAKVYPLATLLAYENKENIIQENEFFYHHLNKNKFVKGSNLQLLSHILSLRHRTKDRDFLFKQTFDQFYTFTNAGIDPKAMYYPLFGLLALLPQDNIDIEMVSNLANRFNEYSSFKQQKDMNLAIAVFLLVSEDCANSHILDTLLYTILEIYLETAPSKSYLSIISFNTLA